MVGLCVYIIITNLFTVKWSGSFHRFSWYVNIHFIFDSIIVADFTVIDRVAQLLLLIGCYCIPMSGLSLCHQQYCSTFQENWMLGHLTVPSALPS